MIGHKGLRAIMLLALAAGLWADAPLAEAQAGPRALAFFQTAGGTIDAATPVEEWTFDGQSGQVVSLIAQTMSGDLDPVLEVLGPGGALVGQNDDLDSRVRDAGLEVLRLPSDGAYIVRVGRWGGAEGTTSGTYRLSFAPGFAQVVARESFEQGSVSWQSPTGAPVGLSAGWLRVPVDAPGSVVLALPPGDETYDEVYMQADARLFRTPSYGEFGLIFRAQGAGSQISYYALRVNSRSQWTVIRHEPNGESTLRTWTNHAALDPTGVTLGVLVRGPSFVFYANGQILGDVSDSTLTGAGRVGVMAASDAGQTDSPQAMFDNVIITTRLGTTYRGLPLALASWQSDDPAAIVAELAGSGRVNAAVARDLYIPEKVVATLDPRAADAQFELLGVEQSQYEDFVLGATLSAITTRDSAACGVVFRWQDERNFSTAYMDGLGGWGMVQAQDALLPLNAYDLSPMITPGSLNDLLVVAQGEQLALYVNGALVTQETAAPGSGEVPGRIGVALLNYEAAQTDCYFYNVWVWPLIG